MLKKQTVWLLTMLSLIIVLSVYYMTSPTPPNANQMAATDNHQKDKKKSDDQKETSKADQKKADEQATAKAGEEEVTTNLTGPATFAAAEEKKLNARSRQATLLTQTITSDTATAEEKAQANEKLKQLNHLSSKEKMLESLIIAQGFGKDALVNVNGDQIKIFVEANSLSNKQAAQILDLVEKKLDMSTSNIYVTYKPGKAE